MVDEVLLELVEYQVEVAVEHGRPVLDDVCERCARRRGDHGSLDERAHLARDRLCDGRDGIVGPRSDDDDRAVGATADRTPAGELADAPGDAGVEQGALPDPARAVEDREPRGEEVRHRDLGLALAAKEEQSIELAVAERREAAERRRERAATVVVMRPTPSVRRSCRRAPVTYTSTVSP